MTFAESITTCFAKYINIKGRASRSEFWLFALFYSLIFLICGFIADTGVPDNLIDFLAVIFALVHIAILIPFLSVAVRRLHDANLSGWFLLLYLVPFVGWIVLLVWFVQKSDDGSNRYDTTPIVEA